MEYIRFNSLQEIKKYYNQQISKGNQSVLKDIKTNGKNYNIVTDEILIAEAKRLQECIDKYISDFYDSHESTYYIRSYGLRDALTVQTTIQYDGNKPYIGLYFDDVKSWGKSVVDKRFSGFKPYLMEFGYKDKSYSTPHFQGYNGYGFIRRGIEDWKSNLKYPIDIKYADSDFEILDKFL